MSDIFGALKEINSEVGVDLEYIKEKIIKAITAVCKNTYGIDVLVEFDSESGGIIVKTNKIVCEKVEDDMIQISLEDAKEINPEAKIGDSIEAEIDTKKFDRVSAQTVKNVVRQGIRDGEKELISQKLRCYEKELVSAEIIKIDYENSSAILKVGEAETTLSRHDFKFIGDRKEGEFIKVYVLYIRTDGLAPIPIVSRSCSELVCKLFESEVPEIKEGIVSIKSVAREAGSRTKIAVASNSPEIDPVGACIGDHGYRIRSVMFELDGEKIDIVRYSDDPIKYIESAISPATTISVQVDSESDNTQNECCVTVPDSQLSLAIGVKGQNVRLASRLTGWKINLRPESGYYGE